MNYITDIPAFVLALLIMLTAGCTVESPEVRAEIERQVAANEQRAEAMRANPMGPMIGVWVVDLDATLAYNASLSENLKEAVRRDLTTYPFELTITDRDYVRRSWYKTNADRYSVVDVNGETVKIALSSADGVSRARDRWAILRVRDGKLLINNGGSFACVLSRSAGGGG